MKDAKSIERANGYRQMFDMWAWKDFSQIMDEKRREALEVAAFSSEEQKRADARGKIRAIDELRSDLDLIVTNI